MEGGVNQRQINYYSETERFRQWHGDVIRERKGERETEREREE